MGTYHWGYWVYSHTAVLGTDMCVCYLTQVYAEADFEPTGVVLAEELVEL